MLEDKIYDIVFGLKENYDTKKRIRELLDSYIIKVYNSLKITKNLLNRAEPVSFYDNYIPLTLTSNKKQIRLNNPLELISKFSKVGIVGPAGSGKTTLVKSVALKCIEDAFAIPVIIELRKYFSTRLSVKEYILQLIIENDTYHNSIEQLFADGRFVFIFDGFDEIDYLEGSALIADIEHFVSLHHKCFYIITSRPGTSIESFTHFYIFELMGLTFSDINIFIEKNNLPTSTKDAIIKSIKDDPFMVQVLNTPLLLSLYILTWSYSRHDGAYKRTVFLRNMIDMLASKHDAISKLGYVRDKISGLDKDALEKISSIIAFRCYFSGKAFFTKDELTKEFELVKKSTNYSFENDKVLYDLQITVNMLIENGNLYGFSHILILEYLSALFIHALEKNDKVKVYRRMLIKMPPLLTSTFLDFLFELDNKIFTMYYFVPILIKILNNDVNVNYQEILMNFIDNNKELIQISGSAQSNKRKIATLIDFLSDSETDNNDNLSPLFDVLN